jgi:hypothetical protein
VLGAVNANRALQSFGSGGQQSVGAQVDAWRRRLSTG